MLETMSEYLLKKNYQHPCKYHKNKSEEILCIFAAIMEQDYTFHLVNIYTNLNGR